MDVCNMIIETCNRDTWMNQFFPNVAQRLCMIDQKWRDAFSQCFVEQVGAGDWVDCSLRRSTS